MSFGIEKNHNTLGEICSVYIMCMYIIYASIYIYICYALYLILFSKTEPLKQIIEDI